MPDPRIAIVHERFTEVAGSEYVAEQLAWQWPDAEMFAALARPSGVPSSLAAPATTWLDGVYKTALRHKSYAPLAPLIPRAFRKLDLNRFDAVVVSHHAWATQVVFATDAPVIAYVHAPARWAWDPVMRAQEAGGLAGRTVLSGLSRMTRRTELAAVPRLDRIVANSTAVAQRISDYWGRESDVVHPPVNTDDFRYDPTVEREDFFLFAGRIVPWKRPDLVIEAAKRADVRLVVAGDGRWMSHCRAIAGPKTTFLGRYNNHELLSTHQRCRALIMPNVEDFGIVPVEAMAAGTPVIALGAGGALDYMIPGKTGILVEPGTDEQIVERLVAAIKSFKSDDYDSAAIRDWSEGFSRANFRAKMQTVLDGVLA